MTPAERLIDKRKRARAGADRDMKLAIVFDPRIATTFGRYGSKP